MTISDLYEIVIASLFREIDCYLAFYDEARS